MEQDSKPRNKPMHLWSNRQDYKNHGKTVFSINGAGKNGQLHVKK